MDPGRGRKVRKARDRGCDDNTVTEERHMSDSPSSRGGNRLPVPNNWLGIAGLIVLLGSVFSFIMLVMLDLFTSTESPYAGILTYVVAPGFFFAGLILILVGRILARRRAGTTAGPAGHSVLVIDFSSESHRRFLTLAAIAGLGFLLVSAIGAYQTYHLTSSTQFCGASCHEPMGPHFTAYQDSSHARVACTACHIGSGAKNLVKAKLNGIHQLCSTALNSYERPITKPGVIPINQKTCEQCHWPERFVGNIERTYQHFLMDETNTPFTVRLLLKVGGGDTSQGAPGGIHWHMNLANKIEYFATDNSRQTIPWVRHTDANGKVTEFRSPDFKGTPSADQIRRMDCMDCHNRPAHQFRSPNDAVDLAIAEGRLSTKLPNIKGEAVKALIAPVATSEEGMQKIAEAMRKAYPNHPDRDAAIPTLQAIFKRNFFPEMKTDWRTHVSNLSHKDSPGCFRCHDGLHKTPDGTKALGASDCNSCHTILAQGAGADLENLSAKGHNFFHIDAEYSDFNCHSCHTGALPKE